MNDPKFEHKLKKSEIPTSHHWKRNHQEEFKKTSLGTMLKKPPTDKVHDEYQKTLTLKIMSLDLNTTEKTHFKE